MAGTFIQQMANNLDGSGIPMLQLFEVTNAEAAVLDAAAHIKFGDLLNVDLLSGTPGKVEKQLARTQIEFVRAVREAGLIFVDTVTVHNGVPFQAEVLGRFQTISYRRKIRFN